MDRPLRDSRQYNRITLRGLSQPTFATKSANNGNAWSSLRRLAISRSCSWAASLTRTAEVRVETLSFGPAVIYQAVRAGGNQRHSCMSLRTSSSSRRDTSRTLSTSAERSAAGFAPYCARQRVVSHHFQPRRFRPAENDCRAGLYPWRKAIAPGLE
jgi:hypothetical protein